MVNKRTRFLRRARIAVFPEYRNECLRKRSFRKEPPQQVGQPECDKKGIRIQPGTKSAGDHGIAHESQNPRHQGHAADGRQGLEQIHYRVMWLPGCAGL